MHPLPMLRTAPPGAFVVYRGPSMLGGGAPIVAILTGTHGRSHNSKTGGMAQLWILPADVAVCGSCPLRPSGGGEVTCYVRTFQGPLSTWKANRDAPVRLDEALVSLRRYGVGPWLAAHAMASVESGWDGVAARAKGWRTFRVLREDEPPMPGEILCPHETH